MYLDDAIYLVLQFDATTDDMVLSNHICGTSLQVTTFNLIGKNLEYFTFYCKRKNLEISKYNNTLSKLCFNW